MSLTNTVSGLGTLSGAGNFQIIQSVSGVYVAYSYYNQVAYSTDGQNWTLQSFSFSDGSLTGLGFYALGKFFIFSQSSGDYIYSSDGINWINGNTGSDNSSFYSVLSGQIYLFSYSNVLTSSDGISWTIQGSNTLVNNYGIAQGNGLFVAINQYPNVTELSEDGITWTTYSDNNIWESIIFRNGVFVATDGLVSGVSTDGINWTTSTLPIMYLGTLSYANGKFIITDGYSALLYSTDGLTWSYGTYPSQLQYGFLVSGGNNKFLIAAQYDQNYNHPSVIGYSTDLNNWEYYSLGAEGHYGWNSAFSSFN